MLPAPWLHPLLCTASHSRSCRDQAAITTAIDSECASGKHRGNGGFAPLLTLNITAEHGYNCSHLPPRASSEMTPGDYPVFQGALGLCSSTDS